MAKRKLGLLKVFAGAFVVAFLASGCQSPPPFDSPSSNPVESADPAPLKVEPVVVSNSAFSMTLSSNRVADGSIVELKLHPLMEIDVAGVSVGFEGKTFPIFSVGGGKDLATLVVLPFNSKPRVSKIELRWQGGNIDIPIEVIDGKYPSEKLVVDEKKVNPPKRVMARIRREVKEIGQLYREVTPERYWAGAFDLPIASEITSRFGNKRLFNGKMASFHQGLDLRARTPLPIRAPEGARVVLSKDLYYTGNTVILDHGYGLFTIYAHLSRLEVRVGDRVAKGRVLGLSGMTGRASGPHLHWGAVLMREKFNPADLTRVLR